MNKNTQKALDRQKELREKLLKWIKENVSQQLSTLSDYNWSGKKEWKATFECGSELTFDLLEELVKQSGSTDVNVESDHEDAYYGEVNHILRVTVTWTKDNLPIKLDE